MEEPKCQCDDCPDDGACLSYCANAGKQWEPSNGTEGAAFIETYCTHCERDKVMSGKATVDQADADDRLYCSILSASFRGEAKEWQYGKLGNAVCIQFVPLGERIPAPRCPHTMELPL